MFNLLPPPSLVCWWRCETLLSSATALAGCVDCCSGCDLAWLCSSSLPERVTTTRSTLCLDPPLDYYSRYMRRDCCIHTYLVPWYLNAYWTRVTMDTPPVFRLDTYPYHLVPFGTRGVLVYVLEYVLVHCTCNVDVELTLANG